MMRLGMAAVDILQQGLWINGEATPARSERSAPVFNPATGEILARVAEAGPEDVDIAVTAARHSFERGDWRRASAAERARVLLRLAERIRSEAGGRAAPELSH